MLKPLRKKMVIKVTMWMLVVVFVAWGAGSTLTSRKNYAGIIFGKKISLQEYNRSYSAVLNRARMLYGDKLSKLLKFLKLENQAWDRLILQYEARRRFIRVSDKDVIERIASYPFFQVGGAFDKRAYGFIVERTFQTTPRDFEESVRGDIAIEKLSRAIVKDISLTEADIRQAYLAEKELADISFILIRPKAHEVILKANKERLLSFYKKHTEEFKSPLLLNVIYARIPFNANKQNARAAAEEIISSIKGGQSLEGASKEHGIKPSETGAFSLNSKIPGIGLSYPFALTALRLKKNQISGIVEANDSFYIMRLKSKKEPSILSFEEAKKQVRRLLIKNMAEEKAKALANDISSRIKAEGKDLEYIAQELNITLKSATDITRRSYIKDIGISEPFARAAFALKEGSISGPVKTKNGYAIIRLDRLKPIDEEKFDKEKDEFASSLLKKRQAEHFQSWFSALKKKARLKDNVSP